jgi:peroxiredoxin
MSRHLFSLACACLVAAPVFAQQSGKNVVLVFYLGVGCPHCVKQLKDLSERADDFARMDTEIIAVSQDKPDANAKSQEMAPLKMKIASDDNYANARRFKSYDDFEEMGIHSTILIDKTGRVYWAKHGGAPFDDVKFVSTQVQRLNEKGPAPLVTSRDK